jgi:hypothetical protein
MNELDYSEIRLGGSFSENHDDFEFGPMKVRYSENQISWKSGERSLYPFT